jgi:hypothetical protein
MFDATKKYLSYLSRHRRFVREEARRLGAPRLLGLLHDWSKYLPGEFIPYRNQFYGNFPERWPDDVAIHNPGLKTKASVRRDFDRAWYTHQRRNKHHWQFYLRVLGDGRGCAARDEKPHRYLFNDDGSVRCVECWREFDRGELLIEALPMPDRYQREMLADWMGAGRAIKGHGPEKAIGATQSWYEKNKNLMILHEETRQWVEGYLYPHIEDDPGG